MQHIPISPCLSKRYLTIGLTSIGMCLIHAQRVNVGVTAVIILNDDPTGKVAPSTYVDPLLLSLKWDSNMIGLLHAMFFIGYFLTQLPGGYLATKLPSNRLFGGCILMSCTFNLLIPVSMVSVGYGATCTVRFIQGLCEGLLFPSCYAILWHWTTPAERSRMGACVLAGVYFGAVLGLPLSGAITHYLRWDVVYYFHGGVGILWAIVWYLLSYEMPAQHPDIAPDELEYIRIQQEETNKLYKETPKIPWVAIFTSLPVLSLNICHFARSFTFYLLITNEPAYLSAFGFNVAANGALGTLPHIGKGTMAMLSGPIADYFHANSSLTPTNIRKLFTCLGYGMEALSFFALYFTDSGTLAIVFLTIGVSFSGITVSGWNINHLDLAPRYASILVAISTAVGTVGAIVMPIITGELTTEQTIGEWQNVFLLSSGILIFAVIFYGAFATAKKQKWAEPLPAEMCLVPKDGPMKQKVYETLPAQSTSQLESGEPYRPDVKYGQLAMAQLKKPQPPHSGNTSPLPSPEDEGVEEEEGGEAGQTTVPSSSPARSPPPPPLEQHSDVDTDATTAAVPTTTPTTTTATANSDEKANDGEIDIPSNDDSGRHGARGEAAAAAAADDRPSSQKSSDSS